MNLSQDESYYLLISLVRSRRESKRLMDNKILNMSETYSKELQGIESLLEKFFPDSMKTLEKICI